MRSLLIVVLIYVVFLSCTEKQISYTYPQIENEIKEESHFDITYFNHFSNLERFKEKKILNWFKDQDSITEKYFSNKDFDVLYKHYDSLENRDSDLARKVQRGESDQTFYLWKDISLERKILYIRNDVTNEIKILYDPISYKDGQYEIEYYKPSYDGRYVAMAMGKPENFFNDILIFDCVSKKIINEPILNTKPKKAGGIKWSPDSKGILYIAFPNKDNDRNSYTAMLKVGENTPKPIFKDGMNGISIFEEDYPVPVVRSKESNYIFIYKGNASDFWDSYYISREDFDKGLYDWKQFYSAKDSIYHDWGTEKDYKYYFKRVKNNNIELCLVDMKFPDFQSPKILFSGKAESQLSSFEVIKNNIYYTVTTNGIETSLYEHVEDGEDKKIDLPISCGKLSFDYRSPYKDDLWVNISGWTSNPKEYYLKDNGEFEFVRLAMWPDYPEFQNIVSEVVEVESHDGIKVPMSIVRRKDHELNSNSMGIITAYGAYGMSETPWFHSPIADFVNQGNIYVSAHVRGGGEKGPSWHQAGFKSTKENSWKDLIACSEYLIEKGYVHSKKLGLNVNSAGGIAGGMAVNERPDLFGVFTGFVPKLNPIRIEALDEYDDSDNIFEYGTVKEEQSYKNLLKMDPVVNLSKENKYPSTLLIIGFRDYLIPPSGPGKYVASLQSFNPDNGKPYLLDVKFDAEHETDWLNDYAKMLYFTMNELERKN